MEPFDWPTLVVRLGKEFDRRGMTDHVKLLRTFYAEALQRDRAARRHPRRPPWTEGIVLEWMAIFHLPPFESVYPVLARGAPCPQCESAPENVHLTRLVFPGGILTLCRRCQARWVVEERPKAG